MAKKSKENMKEAYVFDGYEYAEAARNKSREKLDRINKYLKQSVLVTIALWAVLIAREPLLSALEGLSLGDSVMNGLNEIARVLVNGISTLLLAAFVVIYAVTGAFRDVLKIVHTCGKFAWFVTPFAYIDLAMYFMGVFVGLLVVVFFPCLALLMCRSRAKKENDAAEEFMSHFIPVTIVDEEPEMQQAG